MSESHLFHQLSESAMVELIGAARSSICFAAPGIQRAVATAIADAAGRIGPEAVTVSLDLDSSVMRMGYGHIDAVEILQAADVLLNHSPGLRMGLVIVDEQGHVFTPTALLLEADTAHVAGRNALRLGPEQIREALARLSPAARAMALAGARDELERQRIAILPLEVKTTPIDDVALKAVRAELEEAPPVRFDLARQVRVYLPYLQYVEISLKGAAIQRRRIRVPSAIQSIGASADLEGRLQTTFNMIQSDDSLSSRPIEERLQQIRTDLTRSLDRQQGRVVLKASKPELNKQLKALEDELEAHRQRVADELQDKLDCSRAEIVDYYLPQVIARPPDRLLAESPRRPVPEDVARRWLDYTLGSAFPPAKSLLDKMKLEVVFKDVTFETLNQEDFLDSLKQAFPSVDWDRAHDEFLAAGEKTVSEGG